MNREHGPHFYQSVIGLFILCFTGSLHSMSSMTMSKSKELRSAWMVTVQNSQWHIFAPRAHTPMTFSMDQINSIVSSMSADQKALILYGNTVDGMAQLIEYIQQHGITSATTFPSTSPSSSSSSSPASQKPDFMAVRDHMRMFAHTMSNRVAVPKVTLDRKILEYKAAQIRGNVSILQFEKEEALREINNTFPGLKETIWSWTGWVQHMQQRIRIIDMLLGQEITAQLNTIRTGRLCDAEAVVAAIAARWPYNSMGIITSIDQRQKIQEYINKVGFDELRAAQDLIALRPDYQRKVAEQRAELARQQEVARQQQEQAAQQEIEQRRQQELELQQQYEAELAIRSALPHGMQHEIIETLGNNRSHTEVAQQLDSKIQEVLRQAELHNVVVHPELDWRLQAALKALPQSVNAKDFTFHLATVEHLVTDIQLQAARASEQPMTLMERSPALLAQAVNRYFEYLAPTETELALIVDSARYISDMTTGSEYLSPAVREQRIAQFWQAIDSISFETLSNLSAEDVVDATMYVAARATYVMGARAAIAVVKNLKYVSAAAPRAAALFAERFVKVFDSVIGANPVIVTNEGAVVWNASQEAAAEARQLVHAFDGMRDKPLGKPPEILDDAQKVVEHEAKLETKTVGDLVKESKPGEVKRYARIYEKAGDYGEALKDFELLGPTDVQPMPDGKVGKIGKLADGRTAIVREYSRGKMGEPSGPPTLEIQADSSKIIKFRYRD